MPVSHNSSSSSCSLLHLFIYMMNLFFVLGLKWQWAILILGDLNHCSLPLLEVRMVWCSYLWRLDFQFLLVVVQCSSMEAVLTSLMQLKIIARKHVDVLQLHSDNFNASSRSTNSVTDYHTQMLITPLTVFEMDEQERMRELELPGINHLTG